MKKLAPIFALLVLLSACKKEDLQQGADCQPYATVQPTFADDVTVTSARIVDDCLELVVGYGGGCEAHEFALYWDGQVVTSLPGSIIVELHHDGNGDLCEAYLTDSLHFDLSGIQAATNGISSIDVTVNGQSAVNVPYDN
jgi:hypothetical protein